MKLQDKYRLSFDGQVNASINNKFPYYVFEMKRDIDTEALERAANKAVEYHPIFRMSLKKERGLYYLVPSDAPIRIAVSRWTEDIPYGTPEFGGYPWLIAAGGRRMLFTCAHCLCDGMGAMSFLKTVVTLYLADKGLIAREEQSAASEDAVLKTIEDSFASNAKAGRNAPYTVRRPEKASRISKAAFEKAPEKAALYRFKIHTEEIKRLTDQTETTTFAVLASILAKSLARALKKDKGNITILLPVNMRGMYGSRTDRGFAYTANLNYTIEKCIDRPLFLSSTAFRSQLDAIIDRDYFDYILSEDKKQTDMLIRHPIILHLAKMAFYGMLYSPKASIVYTHLTRLGLDSEVEAQIEDFYISGAAKPSPLIVAMTSTFGEEISITMGQSIKDEALISAMQTVLDELGVRYEVKKAEKLPVIYYLK